MPETPLTADDILSGGRYRGRRPQVIHGPFRSLYDDRIVIKVVHQKNGKDVVIYDIASTGKTESCPIDSFVQWAARRLTDEEDSVAQADNR